MLSQGETRWASLFCENAPFTVRNQEATMPDILHRVGVSARPERVFEALTTIDGLRRWWVSTAAGEPGAGGTIDFGFCRMKVLEAASGRVRWRCVEGPPEWVGTEVRFDLAWKDEQTIVLFTHAGWKEPVEFMHHCSTKWGTFLLSLRDLLEKGDGRPAPRDVKIHVGD
jgi:uncharacterized protein YndB with AHSA1/START domain